LQNPKGIVYFVDTDVDGKLALILILKKQDVCALDLCGSGYGPVVGCCESDN
jgi:hypothetical protein